MASLVNIPKHFQKINTNTSQSLPEKEKEKEKKDSRDYSLILSVRPA